MTTLNRLWQNDEGQDLVEYALIAVFCSLVAYLVIGATGASVNTLWSAFNTTVTAAS